MKDKKALKKYALLASAFFSLCFSNAINAQVHFINQPQNSWLQLTKEQYNNGEYALAAQSASEYLKLNPKIIYSESADPSLAAKYYQTLAIIKQQDEGLEDSAKAFMDNVTVPVYSQRVSYALAHHYFETEQYNTAIPYYENVKLANLNNDEIADLKFELAYSYFTNKQFDKAMPLFEAVDALKGKYHNAGNYYYGLLAYNSGNYKAAMESFKKIDDDPQYKTVVPFYEAEILYFTGQRQKALDKAFKLIESKDKSYYDNELHLLAAQILFEEKRYGDALPYFEHYYDHVDKIRKEELYEMAYSYYRVDEWKNAIEKFKPLSSADDSLGQTAMYLLGDSYLKTGNKKSARNAFSICSEMNFNKQQQEASFLMHSKLSYEMGYYDDAILSAKNLLAEYAQSNYAGEARTILSELLSRTNNYEEAYKTLSQVSDRGEAYYRVYQKVTYGYAMQQLQKGDGHFADSLLSLSLKYPLNEDYAMAANFWKGDIAYKEGRYQKAYDYSKKFVDEKNNHASAISSQATLANATLNLGYAAMELEDYSQAQEYFSQVQKEGNENLANTATLREADAYFMQKNFKEAQILYDKMIATDGDDADYAYLQKAVIAGIEDRSADKVKLLHQIIDKKTTSPYALNARYELGLTYLEDDKYAAAITAFEPLLDNNTGKEYAPKAWMKTAFAYQQLNKGDKAIQAYKHLITEYPAAEERKDAKEALRNLYIENNKPGEYAAFLKENHLDAGLNTTLDSTYYAAAEAQVADSKWKEAKTSLVAYLEKYPDGIFTTRAHYYLGESNYQLKDNKAALVEYDKVLQQPWSEFSENSASRAAKMSFENKDYNTASRYYRQLLNSAMDKENVNVAYLGLMQCTYNNKEYNSAILYTDTLVDLSLSDSSTLDEIQFYKAKSLQQLNKNEEAIAIYKQLQHTRNNQIADEVNYRIAEAMLAKGDLSGAEKQAAENVKNSSGNNYWVVKSYILLADILTKQKDYFNAKATLQSIAKNAQYEDLKKEAMAKLEEVKRLEKTQTKLSGE